MTETRAAPLFAPRNFSGVYAAVYAAIAGAGAFFWWLSHEHSSILPFWAPWEFSWVEFLAAWLSVFWYLRGIARTPAADRPSLARRLTFFAGLLAIYAVLETRFEYLAEHQFYFNRIQHVAMHHLGPLLLALSWPGAALLRGMPRLLRRVVEHPASTGTVYVLQQPVLATVLFVGSFFFWLVPSIHFRAMIDPRLFALMNWTMVIDGILFWCLVLDPRPHPPARVSFGGRAALAVVVMFPQIIGGAMIAFSPHDLYAFYDLCGRIYPDMGALYDQTVGGMIIWIPPAMMSVLALMLVLNALRRDEERKSHDENADDDGAGLRIQASQWTG
jgi:putative membrane protein